jgi:copper resistance protein B
MNRIALIALLPAVWGAPAAAQMDPSMPGMAMPAAHASAKAADHQSKAHRTKATPHKSASSRVRAHRKRDAAPMAGMAMPMTGAEGRPPHQDTSSMPGMAMPMNPPGADQSQAPMAGMAMSTTGAGEHASQDMSSMPGMNMATGSTAANSGQGAMAGMAMPMGANGQMAMGAPSLPDVQTPPPPVPTDFAADKYYDPAAMAAARALVHHKHGGEPYSMVMANLLEYQGKAGGGGYRWDGEAWFGGDINRFVVKSEGDGSRRDGLESAEVQALYSRTIGPYFNLQAGVRQDFSPTPMRTYATVGVEGLVPYWFDVQGALFVSNHGEVLARAEGTYDLRLTQRLILQPRAELNFSAQDVREIGIGSGLTNAELGLRLRYEIRREFAPYIGVSFDRKYGRTADFARAAGRDPGGATFVAGVRAWF